MKSLLDGKAALHHGDCRDVIATLDDESVNCIVTDPPYECSTTVITRKGQKNLDSNFGAWDRFDLEWVTEAHRVLTENAGMVVFVPATRFESFMRACETAGFQYVQPWFWHKSNPPVSMRNALQWAVEHMIYVRKGKHKLQIKNRGSCHNIFKYPIPAGKYRVHPTQKPVGLMMDIVKLCTVDEEVVLDPFNGSGSTGVAALASGRRYIGIEQDRAFYLKTLRRLQNPHQVPQFTF